MVIKHYKKKFITLWYLLSYILILGNICRLSYGSLQDGLSHIYCSLKSAIWVATSFSLYLQEHVYLRISTNTIRGSLSLI